MVFPWTENAGRGNFPPVNISLFLSVIEQAGRIGAGFSRSQDCNDKKTQGVMLMGLSLEFLNAEALTADERAVYGPDGNEILTHVGMLNGIARKLVHTVEDREDLVQATLVAAFSALKNGKGPHTAVKSWLGTVMMNIFRSDLRQTSVEHAFGERSDVSHLEDLIRDNDPHRNFSRRDISVSLEPTPYQETTALEDRNRLYAAIKQLNPIYRAPVFMFHVHEMSVREIAEALDEPEKTVRVQMHRGRQQLKQLLQRSDLGGLACMILENQEDDLFVIEGKVPAAAEKKAQVVETVEIRVEEPELAFA